MKNASVGLSVIVVFLLGFIVPAFAAEQKGDYSPEMQAKIEEVKKELKKFTDERATVKKNLETFDELDYVVFSNQEWTRFHESHANDIKVYWPDGHSTTGLEKHIEDLKAMFVYAPDTNIKVHPVKIGSGDYTSVIGVMTGAGKHQRTKGCIAVIGRTMQEKSLLTPSKGENHENVSAIEDR